MYMHRVHLFAWYPHVSIIVEVCTLCSQWLTLHTIWFFPPFGIIFESSYSLLVMQYTWEYTLVARISYNVHTIAYVHSDTIKSYTVALRVCTQNTCSSSTAPAAGVELSHCSVVQSVIDGLIRLIGIQAITHSYAIAILQFYLKRENAEDGGRGGEEALQTRPLYVCTYMYMYKHMHVHVVTCFRMHTACAGHQMWGCRSSTSQAHWHSNFHPLGSHVSCTLPAKVRCPKQSGTGDLEPGEY